MVLRNYYADIDPVLQNDFPTLKLAVSLNDTDINKAFKESLLTLDYPYEAITNPEKILESADNNYIIAIAITGITSLTMLTVSILSLLYLTCKRWPEERRILENGYATKIANSLEILVKSTANKEKSITILAKEANKFLQDHANNFPGSSRKILEQGLEYQKYNNIKGIIPLQKHLLSTYAHIKDIQQFSLLENAMSNAIYEHPFSILLPAAVSMVGAAATIVLNYFADDEGYCS